MMRINNYPGQNSRYRSLILAAIGALLIAGIVLFIFSLRFHMTGVTPKNKDLGLNTNVVINFNKEIGNGAAIINQIKITPVVKTNVFVEKGQIVILPLGSFEGTTYTVTIPEITSKKGDKISDFKVTFTPNPAAPRSNEKTSQDTEDIATKKYPGLLKVNQNTSDDYKIQYAYDGENVVFDLYLIEPLSVGNEDAAIEGLKKINNQARDFIATLGIPKQNYIIRYQNLTQETLLYGESVPPAN